MVLRWNSVETATFALVFLWHTDARHYASGATTRSMRSAKACFGADGSDLAEAVRGYLHGGDKRTSVQEQYGERIGHWCVGFVEDFSFLFRDYPNFEEDLSKWNTSSATTMEGMFSNNNKFQGDIEDWDVSNVKSMKGMFENSEFDRPLALWNVSSVEDFQGTFRNSCFNQDISRWRTNSATTMSHMFQDSVFNQDLTTWDVSNVQDMSEMFMGAASFHQNLCSWSASMNGGTLTESMFQGSDCLLSSSPQWNETIKLVVGPFCSPCSSGQSITLLQEEEEEAEKLEYEVSRPVINTSEDNDENGLNFQPSVHSHESAAKGVQIVLLMLVIFSLNGLLLTTSCNRRGRTPRTGPYSRLSASVPTDDAETEMSHMNLSNPGESEDLA